MRRSLAVAVAAVLLGPAAASGQSTNDPNNYDPADPDVYRPAPKPQRKAIQKQRVQQSVPGGEQLSQGQIDQGVVVTGPSAAELAAQRAAAAAEARAERRRRAAARRRQRAARRRQAAAAERRRLAAEERLREARAVAAAAAARRARLRIVEQRASAQLATSRATGSGDNPVGVLLLVGGLPAAALAAGSLLGRRKP